MNKKETILLVLDETERSMIVESLYNYLNYNIKSLAMSMKKNKDNTQYLELLEKLNSMTGGFRLTINENKLYALCEALRWNSSFVKTEKEKFDSFIDKYSELSYILDNRNKNLYLFSDFNPIYYTLNTQLKAFKKFDFKQNRILMIRFEKDEMEYIKEFYKKPEESEESYIQRAEEFVIKSNLECLENVKYNEKFLNLKYKAVFFADVLKHKFKKDFAYFE